ncbi:insulinase family protein, partial [Desulfovibrio sp. OttesenSCG-928-M14]|nr:insulinase family protein [Desulfovibrio sp. OttesenSCG-928-M14]
LAAIVTREDQPTSLAFRRMFPFLFSAHPYGYMSLGEKERVANFKAKDAKTFWAKQTLRPWVLSVCGSFDREAVLRAAQKLPVPGKDADDLTEPVWNQDKELSLQLAGRKQAHYFMVFPTVGYGHEDEAGLDVLQNILAGQSGLLFRDLRDEQGLGYTVTALPWKGEKAGALLFYIGTETDKLEQAAAGFAKIIESLRTQVLPEEELERGKNQIRGDYYRDHQSLASRSAEAAILTALKRPLNAARTLVDKAQNVTAEEVRGLAAKYIDQDKAYIIKVLP